MRILVVALFSLVCISAHAAGILFEPYAKYEMGSFQDTVAGVTPQWNTTGYGAGARVGFGFDHIFIAADYAGKFGGKSTGNGGGATDSDSDTATQIGADLGFRFERLRAWVGYNFVDNETSETAGVKATAEGTGYKLGVGYNLGFHVALNAEYVMSTFTKSKDNNGNETDLSSAGVSDAKGHAVVLSLSFPFQL